METEIVRHTQEALWLVLVLSAPFVGAAAVVGLLVSIFQAVTQLQEQTVGFALKLVAVVVVLFLTAALLGDTMVQYGQKIFTSFPLWVR